MDFRYPIQTSYMFLRNGVCIDEIIATEKDFGILFLHLDEGF